MNGLIQKLEAHRVKWADCHRCAIGAIAHKHCAYRLHKVEDRVDCLFIGEAPGVAEDYNGLPFVGPAGQLFDDALCDAGWWNLALCFANVVNCRPTDSIGGENRPPTSEEANNCADRLYELVTVCNPKIVVLVGKVAQDFGAHVVGGDCWSLTHPAFVLRNGGRNGKSYQEFVERLKEIRTAI